MKYWKFILPTYWAVLHATGDEFPLLVKKLQVNDFPSVQVHPDDKTVAEMHNAFENQKCMSWKPGWKQKSIWDSTDP